MSQISQDVINSHIKWANSAGDDGIRMHIERQTISSQLLEGLDLSGARIIRTAFIGLIANNIDFYDTNLGYTMLIDSTVTSCSLTKSNWDGTRFYGSSINESKIFRTTFMDTIFYNCVFKNVSFNLVSFNNALFVNTKFVKCDFHSSDFSDATFIDVGFTDNKTIEKVSCSRVILYSYNIDSSESKILNEDEFNEWVNTG